MSVPLTYIDTTRGETRLDLFLATLEDTQICCWAGRTGLHITDGKWTQQFSASEPRAYQSPPLQGKFNNEQNVDAENVLLHQWGLR